MRPISTIARDIYRTWRKPYFGAVPYLGGMLSLESVKDSYGCDSGRCVVLYFLSNATSWRGNDAGRLKAELREHLKSWPEDTTPARQTEGAPVK
jgi:hypothetical protein